ncbi:hypothetical protein I4U23_022216 [Adineta vaga]|nr:hypothetical protein I4U23_022216 [Adineta vaga]
MSSLNVYLVTGGAGFIGSHLIDRLVELNIGNSPDLKRANVEWLQDRHQIRVLDGRFAIIQGSINDKQLLTNIFNTYNITHIAHLAARARVRSSSSEIDCYMNVNCVGTQLLLSFAALHNVRLFVFASTSSVYGQTSTVPFVETDSCAKPLSPYAATKRSGEILAHVYHNLYGLNVTILRLFNVYGPGGRPDMMPFKLMRACIDPTYVVDVFDNGEIKRDWTYIDDVVQAFMAALEVQFGYGIFNIGCGNPIELSTFIKYIEALSNKHIAKSWMESYRTEPSITYCDNSKARRMFTFLPKTNVLHGLEMTWNWFQKYYDQNDIDNLSSL